MLRLLGAVLILAACVLCGQMLSRRLRERQLFLRGCHQGLLALMREIDYAASPMQRALPAAAEPAGPAAQLFLLTAEKLAASSGCTAGEAWLEALASLPALAEEDRRLLSLLSEGLGLSDAASQLKALELLRQRLEAAEAGAAEQMARYGRIWRSLGWSMGAILILLLL